MKKAFLYMGILFTLFACKKEQFEKDEELIKQYIADNNYNATRTSTGLYYIISDTGTGSTANAASSVKINYVGYLTNGKVFDSSQVDAPPTFVLAQLIKGWQEGIPLIREGGKIKLIVPSALGYGSSSPSSDIPKNSVLVFDIELLDVI